MSSAVPNTGEAGDGDELMLEVDLVKLLFLRGWLPPRDAAGQPQPMLTGKGTMAESKTTPPPPAAASTPHLRDLDLLKAPQAARLWGRFAKILPSSDQSQCPAASPPFPTCLVPCHRGNMAPTAALHNSAASPLGGGATPLSIKPWTIS